MNYWYVVYKHKFLDCHPKTLIRTLAKSFSVAEISAEDAVMYRIKGLYVHNCSHQLDELAADDLVYHLKEHYDVDFYTLVPIVDFNSL